MTEFNAAETAQDNAQIAQDNAQTQYNNAESNLNTATATLATDPGNQAFQDAVDIARTEEAAAQSNLDAATTTNTTATQLLDTERTELNTALTEKDTANQAVIDFNQDISDLNQDISDATTAKDGYDQKIAEGEAKIADAIKNGYDLGKATFANGVGSAIFNFVHVGVGRLQKYTFDGKDNSGYWGAGNITNSSFAKVIKNVFGKVENESIFTDGFKNTLEALKKTDNTPLTANEMGSIQLISAGLKLEVHNAAENFKYNEDGTLQDSKNGKSADDVATSFKNFDDKYSELAGAIEDSKNDPSNYLKRLNIKTSFAQLKTSIENIHNLRTAGAHNSTLDNSLKMLDVMERASSEDFDKTVIASPFNKNKEIVFDKDVMAASKIVGESGTNATTDRYLVIEKVYLDQDGKKVVTSPYINAPEDAKVITLRQYGNVFTQIIEGKEIRAEGQQDSQSPTDNLNKLMKSLTDIDINNNKLSSIIEKTSAIQSGHTPVSLALVGMSIHLYATTAYENTPVNQWQDFTTEQKDELSRSANEDNKKAMSNYDHQIIMVMEGEKVVKDSAYKLASKHPDASTIIFMDKQGNTQHVYGTKIEDLSNKKLRITAVAHGREDNTKTLGGRSVQEFSEEIKTLKATLDNSNSIDRVALLGCNLGEGHDKLSESDYGKNLITALKNDGIQTTVSVRNTFVAIAEDGRKGTSQSANKGSWLNNDSSAKTIYSINTNGDVVSGQKAQSGNVYYANDIDNPNKKSIGLEESNRLVSEDRGNIEDVDFNKVGDSLSNDTVNPNDPTGKNTKVIDNEKMADIDDSIKKIGDSDSPQRQKQKEEFDSSINDAKTAKKTTAQKLASIGANIQINVGDGEHTTLYYGSNNIDIKIGDGGHKTAMFGDNNALVSIGDRGDTTVTAEAGGYTAFEGAQIVIGQRNIAYNYGDRNDFIVMLDKSVPIIPLLNPFEGAAGISTTLKKMAEANGAEQEALWTFDKAKTFSKSMSVLDITSTVEYTSLLDVGSESDISDRGIKYDAEATLNNAINGGGAEGPVSKEKMEKMKLKDKAKAKLKNATASVANTSINFTVAGRGSDIVLANGNFSFIFADNIQSALDTTIASLFGVMQQGFSSTGAPTNTFTFSPKDLKTQLGNSIKNRLASLTEDITVGELMNYAYTQDGHVYAQDGRNVDVGNILGELFTTIIPESYKGLIDTMTNPSKIINTIKTMGGTGVDMIKNGLGALGLPVSSEEPSTTEETSTQTQATGTNEEETQGKSFGFSGLKMPSFFDVLKIPTMLTKIPTLVEDLGKTLTDDVDNMKDKMLEFFTQTGYMKDDGDLVVSQGSQNFVWGGHGQDLIALLGVNNNVWAGEGDDVGYLMGEGNTFSGNNGNDTAVMMGQNHMFIGGAGNDLAVASGRYNNLFGGAGNDQLWAFGTRGLIKGGAGDDYIVSTGNNHDINAGSGDDYSVTIGSGHQVHLGEGNDQAKIFGNKNKLVAGVGKDTIDVYSYDSIIQTDNGNDTVMARAKSKNNNIYTGNGNDTIFIGGLNNTYSAGSGEDIFVMTSQNIEGTITDIEASDLLVFNNFSYKNLWFEQSGNDLTIHNYNGETSDAADSQDWFEEFGALKIDDYFENDSKRAAIVTSVKTNSAGEIVEYEYLDNNTFDKLVEIMASSDKTKGSDGFMTGKSTEFQNDVSLAWSQRTDATRIIA